MPYKQRYKRKTYKAKPTGKSNRAPMSKARQAYRKQNRGFGLNRLSIRSDPFPLTKFCRLVYSGTYSLTTGAAGSLGSEQVFRLNSLYDPDFTSIGHQPRGHDSLALLYKQYKVYGVHVDLEMLDPTADGIHVVGQVLTPQNSGAASIAGQSGSVVAENPFTFIRNINNSGSQRVRYKQYLPMSRLVGCTPLQFKATIASPFTATFGTNPTDVPLLRLASGSARGNAGDTVLVQVRLTYYTMCYERIPLSES